MKTGAKLVIAEPSEIIRKGLLHVIESTGVFASVREVACPSTLRETISKVKPQVLLINPSMIHPGMIPELKECCTNKMAVAAVVYTLFDDDYINSFDQVIMIGDTRQKIQRKLQAVMQKENIHEPAKPEDTLSVRELDVLKLLVRGLSNKEISDKLFISTHTVISHRKNITQKLNIKSVAGLTVYAILNDLVSMEEIEGGDND